MPADFEARVQTLAKIIGLGRAGYRIAREFARRGARTRADLRRPEYFTRLPRSAQVNVSYPIVRRLPLATAERIGAELRRRIRFEVRGRKLRLTLIPVGSVRRKEPTAGDLDFLVMVRDGIPIDEVLQSVWLADARDDDIAIVDSYLAGERRVGMVIAYLDASGRNRFVKTDLFLTTAAEKPYALFHYTGPTSYNIRTRAAAKRRGWKLNQYGIFDATNPSHRVRGMANLRTERQVAEFLGVTYRTPTNRE